MNTMKVYLIFLFAFALSIMGVFPVYAATVSQDITLQTTSGSNITLLTGGAFDSFTVGTDSFTFTLSGTQSVRLRDSDAQILETDIDGLKGSCDGANSEITLSASKGTSIQLTIKAFACSGGGGGGGSYTQSTSSSDTSTTQTTTTATATTVETTTIVQETTPTPYLEGAPPPVAPLSSEIIVPSPVFVPVPTVAFSGISQLNRRLSVGSSGEDVRALQEALASMSDVYPEGTVSGYFGSLTKAAVAKFQMKYGIVSSSSDVGYGSVGPMTRAKLQEVFGGAYSSSASFPTATATAIAAVLTRRLNVGSEGTDVTQLQAYLASDSSLYPEGKVTGYYGSLTSAAVKRFQARYGIDQVGWVGPQTMAKLNEVMGQGASAPPAPVSTGTSPSDDQARAALQSQIQDMQALVNSLTQQIQAAQ